MRSSELLIELGGVLIGLAVLARLAGRLRIPGIPLYLLAGLAFGQGGLLPLVTTSGFIESGAEIGLILLLFTLGLEYPARDLIATMRRQAPSGVLDAILNYTPGFVTGVLLGWGPVAAAVLGGITYMSSSGVVAKLLHDFGWTRNPETAVIVSLLVLEDLAMAVYLPILAGVLIAGNFSYAGLLTAGVALTAVVALFAMAVRIEVGITRFLFSESDEALLLSILGLAIFVAGIAELIQISAAVGALLMGIVMSGPAARAARELIEPLRDFFAAMFFAFFGLNVDPSALPPALGTASVLAVVTLVTKFATGWVIAGRAGLDSRARARTGALLIARGEFSIVIALIAVASGLEFVGPVAIGCVLILVVAGPVIARFVDPLMERMATRPFTPEPNHAQSTNPGESVSHRRSLDGGSCAKAILKSWPIATCWVASWSLAVLTP